MTGSELLIAAFAAVVSLLVRVLSNKRALALAQELDDAREDVLRLERESYCARRELARHGLALTEEEDDDTATT